jgi:DNA recombination-dependent growth factor C
MKKAYFFQLNSENKEAFKVALTNESLENFKFEELTVGQSIRYGFIQHGINKEYVVNATPDLTLLMVRKAEKKLSSAAINNEVAKRIIAFDEKANGESTKEERDSIRSSVVAEQIKSTLPTYKNFLVAINWKDGLVAIEASENIAQTISSLIFKAIEISAFGKVCSPLSLDNEFTRLLRDKRYPEKLRFGDQVTIEYFGKVKTKIAIRKAEEGIINNDSCYEAIKDGGYVSEIGLMNNMLTFVVDKQCNFKSIAITEAYVEFRNDKVDDMDIEEAKAADQILLLSCIFEAKQGLIEQLIRKGAA